MLKKYLKLNEKCGIIYIYYYFTVIGIKTVGSL